MTKYIIEWGAEPSRAYVSSQANYDTIQSSPVDGFVTLLENNSGTSISRTLWSSTEYTISDVSSFISTYQTRARLGWGRTRHNWLLMQTTNTTIDWFDSSAIAVVVNNIKLLGKAAIESGFQGVIIDPESYGAYQFRYNGMPLSATHSLQDYKNKVYEYAKEIAAAWLSYSKDFKVFCVKSYEENYFDEAHLGTNDNRYAFWPSFLNGIYDEFGARQANLRIQSSRGRAFAESRPLCGLVATNTHSYLYSTEFDLEAPLSYLNRELYLGDHSDYYRTLVSFGLSHWIDAGPSSPYEVGFDNVTPANNLHTPDDTKNALIAILSMVFEGASCDYAWIFNLNTHLFGSGTIINSEYITKIREARATLGLI